MIHSPFFTKQNTHKTMEFTNLRHRTKSLEHIEVVDRPSHHRRNRVDKPPPVDQHTCFRNCNLARDPKKGWRKSTPDLEILVEEIEATRGFHGATKQTARDSTDVNMGLERTNSIPLVTLPENPIHSNSMTCLQLIVLLGSDRSSN